MQLKNPSFEFSVIFAKSFKTINYLFAFRSFNIKKNWFHLTFRPLSRTVAFNHSVLGVLYHPLIHKWPPYFKGVKMTPLFKCCSKYAQIVFSSYLTMKFTKFRPFNCYYKNSNSLNITFFRSRLFFFFTK